MITEAWIIGGCILVGLVLHAIIVARPPDAWGHKEQREERAVKARTTQAQALDNQAAALNRLADNLGRLGLLLGKKKAEPPA